MWRRGMLQVGLVRPKMFYYSDDYCTEIWKSGSLIFSFYSNCYKLLVIFHISHTIMALNINILHEMGINIEFLYL